MLRWHRVLGRIRISQKSIASVLAFPRSKTDAPICNARMKKPPERTPAVCLGYHSGRQISCEIISSTTYERSLQTPTCERSFLREQPWQAYALQLLFSQALLLP